jgi:hypothetical protein
LIHLQQIGDLLDGEKFRDSGCLARACANAVAWWKRDRLGVKENEGDGMLTSYA